MLTDLAPVSWEEAVRGFVLHKKAVRSLRTAAFYRNYTINLARWADRQGLRLTEFTKRHLDEYLAYRADLGKKPTTLHHDALAAKVLFKWCTRNDLVERNPLA